MRAEIQVDGLSSDVSRETPRIEPSSIWCCCSGVMGSLSNCQVLFVSSKHGEAFPTTEESQAVQNMGADGFGKEGTARPRQPRGGHGAGVVAIFASAETSRANSTTGSLSVEKFRVADPSGLIEIDRLFFCITEQYETPS